MLKPNISVALLVTIGALTCAWNANAQTAAAAVNTEEIIVTGSRLIVNGNQAPTPVTVVGAEELLAAAPTSTADALSQVPQFNGSTRPSTFITPQGSTGAFLNLRGLGQSRALVLFDGRRTTPTTIEGRTDINLYPANLLKRVDIVTGGASAAYGSDAVAGVVNFVLDKKFEGFKADIGGSISSREDDRAKKAALAFGQKFMGGKIRLVGSAEYTNSAGIFTNAKREWDKAHWAIIANPNYNTTTRVSSDGRPANLLRANATNPQLAYGGVITALPTGSTAAAIAALRGLQFLPGGLTSTLNPGAEATATTAVGGDGGYSSRGNFDTPILSSAVFLHSDFNVTDNFTFFAEAAHSSSVSSYFGTDPSFAGNITIYSGNAYLPKNVQTAMTANNVASFSLGRLAPDWGRNQGGSNSRTDRGAFGFNTSVASWDVDGAFDVGRTTAILQNNHSPNLQNVFNALDAVISPTTGLPVCRSTLTFTTNGCVPLNIFGAGSATQPALDYILANGGSTTYISQQSGIVSARSEPFNLPAGPVGIGVGLEWRKTTVEQLSDALSQATLSAAPGSRGLAAALNGKLGYFLTGGQSSQPKSNVTVKEFFVEALAPLAKDLPFLYALDLNVAARRANYSTTGGISSWKLGLTYSPIADVRLRTTKSRDVRAPNLAELYAPLNGSLAPLNDLATNPAAGRIPIYTGGNPALVPELADTVTAGFVFTPNQLPGFSASVDHYRIKINQAIGNIGAQNILDQCNAGNTAYCGFVVRLSDRTLVSVTNPTLNQSKVELSGVDFEFGYKTALAKINPSLVGDLSVRTLFAHLIKNATTDALGGVTDIAGVTGGENVGSPNWKGNLSVSYKLGGLTLFAQERFIGKGLYSLNYVEGGTGTNGIDDNSMEAIRYTDFTTTYRFNEKSGSYLELYGTVNNLFDKDPPVAPGRNGVVSIISTNPTLYDTVGRYFTAGLRIKF